MTELAPAEVEAGIRRRRLLSAFLLPGLGLFAFFLVPASSSRPTGPTLLIDSLFWAMAVLAFALAVLVVVAEPELADRAASIAAALCLMVGVSVLFSGLATPFRDWRAMAGAALATAGATAGIYVERYVWSRIKVTSRILIGILVAVPVPLFNFWNQTTYLPSHDAPSLELSTQAVMQQGPDGAQHWVITSTIRNPSDVRVFVIASSLKACRWEDEVHWRREVNSADRPSEDCEGLVAPFSSAAWLDPDISLTVRTPAGVDLERALLEVRLRVAYARGDRVVETLDSGRDATAAERGRCHAARVWALQPSSRLAALARRELEMMYADVEGDGGLTYFFGVAGSIRCVRNPYDPTLNQTRFQGLNQYLALTEATTVWASWPTAPVAPDDTATS